MTMTNAEWCIKNGIPFRKVTSRSSSDQNYESIGYDDAYGNYNECYKGKRLGEDLVSESILTWLDMEHKEPILNTAEKKYLSAVIKPFRDRIEYIAKVREEPLARFYKNDDIVKYYISIHFNDENDDTAFPLFREDAMYKGMEPYREYTLEELGL